MEGVQRVKAPLFEARYQCNMFTVRQGRIQGVDLGAMAPLKRLKLEGWGGSASHSALFGNAQA